MSPAQRSHSPSLSAAARQARAAWRMQYRDSRKSLELAEQACVRALATSDMVAEGWARLTRGVHLLRYGPRTGAQADLALAQVCFDALEDEAGRILTRAWFARSILLEGRTSEALALLLPLREPGLRVLKEEERGMLLNNIAGCHSMLGQSAQAFAYMYQALRETSAAHNRGFDVVLYNNIGFELCQLGDSPEALRYLDHGIERSKRVANARLTSTLLANRVACLIELARPSEAMADIEHLLAMPADPNGRGQAGARFETMAIAALRAGEVDLGADLIARANELLKDAAMPDERIELAVATAELLRSRGDRAGAMRALERAIPYTTGPDAPGPRTPCLLYRMLADLSEQAGDAERALAHLRRWQQLHEDRVQRASQARFQAAALQTELLRLRHERDEIDARRRSSERAQHGLEAMNRQLSQKVREVQALQAALRDQAVRDFLTGLFNRRYLNEVLPSMLALAERNNEPLGVAIIDFDHFKAVNDEHGHVAGDNLLAEFGQLLVERLRKSDVACRYGGEEFCLLMPHTDAASVRRKVASLQDAWRQKRFVFETGTVSGCTISAGIADSQQTPGSPDALLRAADAAGLDAKRRGRDRVVIAGHADRLRVRRTSLLGTVAGE
jgi:diguanylate cyclase (GGDEF)-like protein